MNPRRAGRLAAAAAGATLAIAGVVKLTPWVTALLSGGEAPAAAMLHPAVLVASAVLETGLGSTLLVRPESLGARRAVAALLLVFLVVSVVLRASGIPLAQCGCFGALSGAAEPFHMAVIGGLMLLVGLSFVYCGAPLDGSGSDAEPDRYGDSG